VGVFNASGVMSSFLTAHQQFALPTIGPDHRMKAQLLAAICHPIIPVHGSFNCMSASL